MLLQLRVILPRLETLGYFRASRWDFAEKILPLLGRRNLLLENLSWKAELVNLSVESVIEAGFWRGSMCATEPLEGFHRGRAAGREGRNVALSKFAKSTSQNISIFGVLSDN